MLSEIFKKRVNSCPPGWRFVTPIVVDCEWYAPIEPSKENRLYFDANGNAKNAVT